MNMIDPNELSKFEFGGQPSSDKHHRDLVACIGAVIDTLEALKTSLSHTATIKTHSTHDAGIPIVPKHPVPKSFYKKPLTTEECVETFPCNHAWFDSARPHTVLPSGKCSVCSKHVVYNLEGI